jgi:Tfp pilus assembly protein PilE
LTAFTLVETIIAMTLVSVIFLLITQAFSSLLLGSYLIDARTTVRNESEFVGEYFKLRIKNADPRTVSCSNGTKKYIAWQSKGSTDFNYFFLLDSKFCFSKQSSDSCDTVLTYSDVIVKEVRITCDPAEFAEAPIANVNLTFKMDSSTQLGDRPAVQDVSRFVSISIR